MVAGQAIVLPLALPSCPWPCRRLICSGATSPHIAKPAFLS